jgi:hypothetical protein
MSDVKRYSSYNVMMSMEDQKYIPTADGKWVTYDDYAELETRLEEVENERDALIVARDMMGRLWEQEKGRAEAAEDALATARRDALQSVLDNIREWAWPEDGTYPPEEQAIQNAERWTVEFIESQIRAMKDAKP